MTDQERLHIDAACARILEPGRTLHHHAGSWWVTDENAPRRIGNASTDASLAVPLAEALRARGWEWGHISWDSRGYRVTLNRAGLSAELDWVVDPEWYETMEEALAVAAARAMGRSGEE